MRNLRTLQDVLSTGGSIVLQELNEFLPVIPVCSRLTFWIATFSLLRLRVRFVKLQSRIAKFVVFGKRLLDGSHEFVTENADALLNVMLGLFSVSNFGHDVGHRISFFVLRIHPHARCRRIASARSVM